MSVRRFLVSRPKTSIPIFCYVYFSSSRYKYMVSFVLSTTSQNSFILWNRGFFFKHIVNLEALFGTFTFTVFLRIINLQQVFHPLSLLVQKFTFLYSFVVAFLGDPFAAIIFGQSVPAKSCRMCSLVILECKFLLKYYGSQLIR